MKVDCLKLYLNNLQHKYLKKILSIKSGEDYQHFTENQITLIQKSEKELFLVNKEDNKFLILTYNIDEFILNLNSNQFSK